MRRNVIRKIGGLSSMRVRDAARSYLSQLERTPKAFRGRLVIRSCCCKAPTTAWKR